MPNYLNYKIAGKYICLKDNYSAEAKKIEGVFSF